MQPTGSRSASFFIILISIGILVAICVPFGARLSWATGNDTTQGGNVTSLNISEIRSGTWGGLVGQASGSAPTTMNVSAIPNSVNSTTVATGSGACVYGANRTIIFFSNSTDAIVTLGAGNLSTLDRFVNRTEGNGSSTFTRTMPFDSIDFGNISSVPYTYTFSPTPSTFWVGYFNDQSGNIIIASETVSSKQGFNGSNFDFQLILPTNNGTNTVYQVTPIVRCNSRPTPPTPPPEPPPAPPHVEINITTTNLTNVSGLGNITGNASGNFSGNISGNETRENATIEEKPEIKPGQPRCIPNFVCGSWSECVDGRKTTTCRETSGCIKREIYMTRSCWGSILLMQKEVEVSVPGFEKPFTIDENGQKACFGASLLAFILFLAIDRIRKTKR